MTVVSAHQPGLYCWLGLLQKVLVADTFIIMDKAKFRKREFMHRNRVEIANSPKYIGMPVSDSADNMLCDQVQESTSSGTWMKTIQLTLRHSYGRKPYWSDIELFLDATSEPQAHCLLVDLFVSQLEFFCRVLDIKTKIIFESELFSGRSIPADATQRLLAHAMLLEADTYVTGLSAASYLRVGEFHDQGIACKRLLVNYDHYLKYQTGEVPLSVLHQLAYLGNKSLSEKIRSSFILDNNWI